MAVPTIHQVEHSTEIAASAALVYELVADVENWPQVFPPTVYVQREPLGAMEERMRIWATANGTPKAWTSRRRLDRAARRIEFRQEVSSPPVASMGGTWLVEELSSDRCRVRLLHDYAAVDDDPAGVQWIASAVDTNSRSELGALKAHAENVTAHPSLLLDFTDSVQVRGATQDVYDFLNGAELWEQRLPHVARVSLQEDVPGLQVLEMDTRTKDGSTHTTKSIRVCFQDQAIVYKQIQVPALMTVHTGRWSIKDIGGGLLDVSSQHTVVLNPATVSDVLGAQAGVADARDFVHTALSGNSSATLRHAKEFAESRALAAS
jgi:aromatase